jgi:hypothetical protein
MSEGVEIPLKTSSNDVSNFSKYNIFVRRWPVVSDPLSQGIEYPVEQLAEGTR